MTAREAAEMQELGMSPEDLERRKAQVAAITAIDKPSRKKRSDAGKPKVKELCDVCHQPVVFQRGAKTSDCRHVIRMSDKPKQAAAQPGALTQEQAQTLLDLIQERDNLRVQWDVAIDASNRAADAFNDADAAVIAFIRANTAGVK